ncbi:MAG: MauE/DoxX family redox-associated membrane protein [Bacteroidia bacterium]
MVKKIILCVLCILMGAVFVFSGYTKLNPIEPFEYTFVDLGVAGWRLAPFVARLFISLEFFIGALFLLNIKIKAVCKIAFVTLIVFSLYLLGLMFIVGNKGNCGCFGNYLAMTPLQALIKNIIMMAVVIVIYKYYEGFSFKKDTLVFYILFAGTLIAPHILNYVDLDYSEAYLVKKEDVYKMELDTLYKYAEKSTPVPRTLSTGKHIIAFMSATCPHCRMAAKKVKIIAEKNPAIPFYLVLNGKGKDLDRFFEDTKLTNVPYTNLNGKGFVYMAGLVMPYICLVNNDTVETSVDYIHLDQNELEKWLKK